jgi:hypothetical protein
MSSSGYFAVSGRDWQRGGGANMFSTNNLFDNGTTGFNASFDGASNTIKNKTNARATMQMVCIHQEVNGEKLYKSHYNQMLFRLIEPHDHDHLNFLLMRNEIVEHAFMKLDSMSSTMALYNDGTVNNHLKYGTYPYGRYQTLPQINYSLALAQLEQGTVLSYSDVWSRIRPSGICLTSESSQENFDVAKGDIRAMLTTGPSKMHNYFGKGIEIGWQFGVLIKPIPIHEGDTFEYRVSIDGKPQKFCVKGCKPDQSGQPGYLPQLGESSEINQAVARGFIWQMDFYCCPDRPELTEYMAPTDTISSSGSRPVKVTGGYIRLGRINYEHLETKDFFDSSRKEYTMLNTKGGNAQRLSACAVDMDACCLAPILDVFWDPNAQKFT